MTAESQTKILVYLKGVESNKEINILAVRQLGERISSLSGIELQQTDESTLWTIIDALVVPARIFEVVVPTKRIRQALTRMGSESTDPDEMLDDTNWGEDDARRTTLDNRG